MIAHISTELNQCKFYDEANSLTNNLIPVMICGRLRAFYQAPTFPSTGWCAPRIRIEPDLVIYLYFILYSRSNTNHPSIKLTNQNEGINCLLYANYIIIITKTPSELQSKRLSAHTCWTTNYSFARVFQRRTDKYKDKVIACIASL